MTLIISGQPCRISDWVENCGKMCDVINNQPIRNSMSLLIWNQPIKRQTNKETITEKWWHEYACTTTHKARHLFDAITFYDFHKDSLQVLLLCMHFLAVPHPTKQNIYQYICIDIYILNIYTLEQKFVLVQFVCGHSLLHPHPVFTADQMWFWVI